MSARLLVLLGLALCGCRDFGASLAQCVDAGRCSDGVIVDTDAGADAGAVDAGFDAGPPYDECGLFRRDFGRRVQVCDNDAGQVEVFRFRRWVGRDGGTVDEPFTELPRLWVEDAGAWFAPTVTQVDAGHWIASGVPAGAYMVKVNVQGQATLIAGCTRQLDLSVYRLGRPGVAVADPGVLDDAGEPIPTVLNVTFSSVPGYQPGDDIQFLAPSVGIGYGSFTNPNQMLPGFLLTDGGLVATPGTLSFDWNRAIYPFLLSAAQNDALRAVHLKADATDGGVRYFYSAASATDPSLTMTSNAVNSSNLTFSSVSRRGALDLRVDIDAFTRAPSSFFGAPTPTLRYFTLQPAPARVARGKIDAVPDTVYTLFEATDGGSINGAAVPLPLAYGDPFPGVWGQLAEVAVFQNAEFSPGGPSVRVWASHIFDGAQLNPDAGTIELHAGLSGAKDLTVDDENAGPLGDAPRLTWSAGSSCLPDYYTVALIAPGSAPVIRWIGPSTQMQFPPGTIPAANGSSYVFRVTSTRAPHWDAAAPLLSSTPIVETSGLPAGIFTR